MAITYEPIATTTLSTSVASVTFSSISSSYTDLVLVINVKSDVSGLAPRMRFNNDSGSNYSFQRLSGNGSTASSGRANDQTTITIGSVPNAYSADGFVGICNILNYANTTAYKTALNRGGNAADGTEVIVGLWRNTNAINRVDVVNTSGYNWTSGSTFTLYGIASA